MFTMRVPKKEQRVEASSVRGGPRSVAAPALPRVLAAVLPVVLAVVLSAAAVSNPGPLAVVTASATKPAATPPAHAHSLPLPVEGVALAVDLAGSTYLLASNDDRPVWDLWIWPVKGEAGSAAGQPATTPAELPAGPPRLLLRHKGHWQPAALAIDRDGVIWIGGKEGLWQVRPDGRDLVPVMLNGVEVRNVLALAARAEGGVYVLYLEAPGETNPAAAPPATPSASVTTARGPETGTSRVSLASIAPRADGYVYSFITLFPRQVSVYPGNSLASDATGTPKAQGATGTPGEQQQGVWVAWREHGDYGQTGEPRLAHLSSTGRLLARLPFFELAGGVITDGSGYLYWTGRLRPTTAAGAALPLPQIFATTAAAAGNTANSDVRPLTAPGLVGGPQRTWAGSGAALHPAGLLWTGREASVDGVRPVLFVLPASTGEQASPLAPAVRPGLARTDPIPFLDQVSGLATPPGYLGPVFVLPGGELTLTGANFGASPGTVRVQVGGVTARPISWSDTEVRVSLTAGTPTGKVDVEVLGSGEARAVPQSVRVKTGDVPGVLQVMRTGFPARITEEDVSGNITVRGSSAAGRPVEKSSPLLTGLTLLDLPNGSYTLYLTATVRTRQWDGLSGTWVSHSQPVDRTFRFEITDTAPAVVFTF